MHQGHHISGSKWQPHHQQPSSHRHQQTHVHQSDNPHYSNYPQFPPAQYPTPSIFPHLTPVNPPPPIGISTLQPPQQWPAFQQPYFQTHGSPMHSRPFRGRNKQHGFKNQRETPNRNKPNSQPAKVKILCEVCDRSFPSEDELAEHLSLHKVCGIDGCQFSAHPKVVVKHVEAQHDTGLFKKLVLGTAPEDVARWREERKKRFPTRANIQLKLATEKEQFERGERIRKPRGGFNNKRNQWKQSPQLPSERNFQNNRNFKDERNKDKFEPIEPEQKHKIAKKEDNISVPKLPSALATLVANYGDTESDDSSDEAPEQTAISRQLVGPPPPEKKIRMEQAPPRKVQPMIQTAREKYAVHNRPPTLLQKLLEREIRHERNVILQCVRYVVQNNFFQ